MRLLACFLEYEPSDPPDVLRYVGEQGQFRTRHREQLGRLASLWVAVGLAAGEKAKPRSMWRAHPRRQNGGPDNRTAV